MALYTATKAQMCLKSVPSGDSGEMPPCTMRTERNCLVWKCDFQDRKRGFSYHTPQSPPAEYFCWKFFNFMGKHKSLERAGGLLIFWCEDETLKEKWICLTNRIWTRQEFPLRHSPALHYLL